MLCFEGLYVIQICTLIGSSLESSLAKLWFASGALKPAIKSAILDPILGSSLELVKALFRGGRAYT